jgi:N-acetylneuraminic acid mutarotase
VPRYDLACVATQTGGARVICFGGYTERALCPNGKSSCKERVSESYLLDDVFVYDPAADRVESKRAVLPVAVRGLSCVDHAATSQIYCFGGQKDSGVASDLIVAYDPAKDQMVPKSARLPAPRYRPSCAHAGGDIFCFGGQGADGPLASIVRYTPASDTITELSVALPGGLSRLSCVGQPDTQHIYCVGGRGQAGDPPLVYDEPLAEILDFDTATEAITTMSVTLSEAREGHACARHAQTIFCLGGARHEVAFDEIVALTP